MELTTPKYTWEQLEGMMANLIISQQKTEKMFQDTDKKFQDTDKKFQDTDKKFQENEKRGV